MTASGVVVGAVVVAGACGVRSAVTRAGKRARAERLRGALEGRPLDALARASLAPPGWFVEALTFVPTTTGADRAWRTYLIAGAVAAFVASLLAGPVLAALAILLVGAVPFVVRAVGSARRASAYDTSLVVGLDGLARAVRSGGSLHSAIGEAASGATGQVRADLTRVATAMQCGARFDDALAEWRASRDRPSVRLAVGAIALAAQTGGPPARVIEDVAASLRTRMQIEGEARSLGAQARLSALVVGVAPVGFALVACAVDSRNAHLMFGTPIGVACLVVGLVLDVAGAVWMHRISETVLR